MKIIPTIIIPHIDYMSVNTRPITLLTGFSFLMSVAFTFIFAVATLGLYFEASTTPDTPKWAFLITAPLVVLCFFWMISSFKSLAINRREDFVHMEKMRNK